MLLLLCSGASVADINVFAQTAAAASSALLPVPADDAELPEVHTRDPHEEANAIRKTFRIKVGVRTAVSAGTEAERAYFFCYSMGSFDAA